eukprot:271522_1
MVDKCVNFLKFTSLQHILNMHSCKLLRNALPRCPSTCNNHTITTTISHTHFHSSPIIHFPVTDYNVFWLRQPRKWDFIECGNHPEMHPGQNVPHQEARVLFGRHTPQHKKRRPKSEDTFNRWWEVPPWEHDHPGARVPCTLNTKHKGIIDFTLDRGRVNIIEKDLRAKCTLFNFYMRFPTNLSMTPHKLIQESWKHYINPTLNSEIINDNKSDNINDNNSNYYLKRYEMNNKIYNESTLATKFVNHYQMFLKDIKRRMIFDDVESLHFEQYFPNELTSIIIPCRFYGLDQWFPINRDGFFQWRAPRKNDRPRYVQHEYEIEFMWDGKDINKIPRHLSITVEQFCLPWKTEITLDDIKLPNNLIPLKPASDIKILSLDFSKMHKTGQDKGYEEEEEEEIDLLTATY